MLSSPALLGFALAVLPLVVTPGASFTLVSAQGLAGDCRGAWAVIAGTGAGIVTHGVLAGAGLAVVVMRSAELYRAVRLVGALYLVGLGCVLLWRAWTSPGSSPTPLDRARTSALRQVRRAYVANVLNVKAASVYLGLAPQFVPAAGVGVGPMTALALVHVVVMAAWLGLWSTGLTALSERLDPRRWVRRIDAVGGTVLVTLGLRTAVGAR